MRRTIAVVGSSTFPLQRGVGHILRMMHDEPGDILFQSRADKTGEPIAGPDAMVALFARSLHRPYASVWLDPNTKPSERGLERDTRMVAQSDVVWAFFDPNRTMEGGTANVVNIAMNRWVEVHAWTIDEGDNLIEVGSMAAKPIGTATLTSASITGLSYKFTPATPTYKPPTMEFTISYDEVE